METWLTTKEHPDGIREVLINLKHVVAIESYEKGKCLVEYSNGTMDIVREDFNALVELFHDDEISN
jgi:hypothetical protein